MAPAPAMPVLPAAAIDAPQLRWAEALHAAALAPPPPVDEALLLDWFRAHSTFYRRRIGRARRLADVPPLEKAELANVPVAPGEDLRATRTSGTSGFQVSVVNDRREREFRRALLYRPQLFYDLPRLVHQVVFVDGNWCATPDMPPKRFVYGGREYRTWFVGAAADPGPAWQLLDALRPQLIRGIASAILRFVELAPEPLADIRPRYVGSGGEYLLPAWRARIGEAFGAPVLDRYGATETGALAWQCPHCGEYHANVDQVLLEDDADGLLATPLFLRRQPLLRYRLGDRVRLGPPVVACPVRLPTLVIEAARRDDWILAGDGQRVSPLAFQFEQLPGLCAWRLHQAASGALCLYYDAEDPPAVESRLREALRAIV
ncbi:MAG: hypothetical protein D6727_05595, partial [Gammaproteobacteria bacterium]